MRLCMQTTYNDDLIDRVRELVHKFIEQGGTRLFGKIYMNEITLKEIEKQTYNSLGYCSFSNNNTIFGFDIEIDNRLAPFRIDISDRFDHAPQMYDLFDAYKGGMFMNNLPNRVCFNKNATVLLWNDDTKTIVRKDEEDEFNPIIGFLYAYFYKHSGMSKGKAKKYLEQVKEEYNKKKD